MCAAGMGGLASFAGGGPPADQLAASWQAMKRGEPPRLLLVLPGSGHSQQLRNKTTRGNKENQAWGRKKGNKEKLSNKTCKLTNNFCGHGAGWARDTAVVAGAVAVVAAIAVVLAAVVAVLPSWLVVVCHGDALLSGLKQIRKSIQTQSAQNTKQPNAAMLSYLWLVRWRVEGRGSVSLGLCGWFFAWHGFVLFFVLCKEQECSRISSTQKARAETESGWEIVQEGMNQNAPEKSRYKAVIAPCSLPKITAVGTTVSV
jgi:hypothetical protein